MFHLLNGFLYRYNARDTEECRLKNSVRTVAQTNLLCNLRGVDIVNLDIVVCKVFLYSVRHELNQLLTFIDGIQ